MPDTPQQDGLTAQVLVEIGKLQTQVAVMDERLKQIPDHEQRLRDGERERGEILAKLDTISASAAAARDVWARVIAVASAMAAGAAVAAEYVHH
jgi:hypothetical protein